MFSSSSVWSSSSSSSSLFFFLLNGDAMMIKPLFMLSCFQRAKLKYLFALITLFGGVVCSFFLFLFVQPCPISLLFLVCVFDSRLLSQHPKHIFSRSSEIACLLSCCLACPSEASRLYTRMISCVLSSTRVRETHRNSVYIYKVFRTITQLKNIYLYFTAAASRLSCLPVLKAFAECSWIM